MPKNKPYSNPPRAPQTVSNTAASENVGARKNASVQETKKGARARLQRDAEKSFGKAGPTMHKAASYVDNAFAGVAAAPYTVMEMFDPKAKVGTSYNEAKGDWNLTKKLSK